MSEFEKRFGRYALRNLPLIMIICYAVGYAIRYINPDFLMYLNLDPYKIIHGQIWRIVTWLLVPPNDNNIFWVIIMLFCYYSIGVSLERTWGTYKYNVYIFSGIGLTLLGAFLTMGIAYIAGGGLVAAVYSQMVAAVFSTYYINMSILLAFAMTFPDAMFLFMFFIPVKAKWMAILYLVILAIQFVTGGLFVKVALGMALLNFAIFYFRNRRGLGVRPVQMRRRQAVRTPAAGRDLSRSSGRVTRHKCAICGRTEEDAPDMQFRFCTKCEGNYEYCEEHLYTHTHVRMS
ncbi:MAG: hypothetical protein K5673_03225 [Lachnospiraceae bacterium]|nr:hypothetical protein [Lachnospiraceae bacterium]